METIEQLTLRANGLMKRIEDHQVSAGRVLAELKERISNKSSEEGAEWHHSWRQFALRMLERSYKSANKLIAVAKAPDPNGAMANHRARQRDHDRRYNAKVGARSSATEVDEVDDLHRQFANLKAAWHAASPEVRDEFLAWARLHLAA